MRDRRRRRVASGAAFATIQQAVEKAQPGDLICVRSVDHQGERVHVTRSGTAEAPIRLLALGAVRTAGFVVEADHVTIEGFTVGNHGHADHGGRQMGIYLAGTGNAVLRSVVTDSDSDGIGCEIYAPNCPDAVIAGNIAVGADGSGIVAAGSHVLVEGNDVSGSRKVNAGDADGMRFFGAGIVIRGNYVHDISYRRYPAGEESHTDCFQTFEGDPPAAKDVLIENNVCENVAHQCLIATSKTPGRSARIAFRGNHCGNTGSQALLIGGIAGVRVERNVFLPSCSITASCCRTVPSRRRSPTIASSAATSRSPLMPRPSPGCGSMAMSSCRWPRTAGPPSPPMSPAQPHPRP